MEQYGAKWSKMETRIRFIGFKFSTIDENGRIIVPSIFRENIKTSVFFAVPGFSNMLHLYPEESFNKLEDKISKLESEEDRKNITDYIYSNSVMIKKDSQWRISVPAHLLEHASIEHAIKIVGGNDKLDIWNPKLHEEYNKSLLSLGSNSFKKIGL